MFSIGQIIRKSVFEDDFGDRFSGLDVAVALDLDKRSAGWKPEFAQSITIEHTVVWMD